jgi:pterin-4a-carbinolamine dehydratase
MQEKAHANGWKQLESDENAEYLYKEYPVKNFSSALTFVTKASGLIMKARQDKTSHLSLDSYTVTVSLNYPAKSKPGDAHYALAVQIDAVSG